FYRRFSSFSTVLLSLSALLSALSAVLFLSIGGSPSFRLFFSRFRRFSPLFQLFHFHQFLFKKKLPHQGQLQSYYCCGSSGLP
ncbi:hypothetical protein, partial [Halobacillus massiliensis]|uniref:hypothetical protein n=1 Tax=Halobacillus massiliensis TaxID=1926286 RepID=UPI001C4DECD6